MTGGTPPATGIKYRLRWHTHVTPRIASTTQCHAAENCASDRAALANHATHGNAIQGDKLSSVSQRIGPSTAKKSHSTSISESGARAQKTRFGRTQGRVSQRVPHHRRATRAIVSTPIPVRPGAHLGRASDLAGKSWRTTTEPHPPATMYSPCAQCLWAPRAVTFIYVPHFGMLIVYTCIVPSIPTLPSTSDPCIAHQMGSHTSKTPTRKACRLWQCKPAKRKPIRMSSRYSRTSPTRTRRSSCS